MSWLTGAFVALLGCSGPEATVNLSGAKGGILVEVRTFDGELVEGALVTTSPATEDAMTDSDGTAMIEDVTPRRYRVIAEKASLGSVSKTISVQADRIAEVYLEFEESEAAGDGGSGGTGGGGGSGGTGGDGGSGGTGGGGAPSYIAVNTHVDVMLVDSKRPYLYALDSVNNELHFINLDDNSVEKSLFVGSVPVDMDMDLAGDFLYIANNGSTQLAVVDLETQEVSRNMFVDTSPSTTFDEGNPFRIEVTAFDTLMFVGEDYYQSVKQVNATNGASIAVDDNGSNYQPDLAASPDGMDLFVGEEDWSGALVRYSVAADGLSQVDSTTIGDETAERVVVLSGDGMFVFYGGQKFLAANLQSVLGAFGETIYASNVDGSIVVGEANVYSGTMFNILRPLGLTTNVIAMTPDATTVYLYDIATSRIYIEDISDL